MTDLEPQSLAQKKAPVDKSRVWMFLGVMGLSFMIFIGRLFSLQVIQGADFVTQAEENRTSIIRDRTLRGVIYDRNGIILARNISSYNVAITPAYMPDDEGEMYNIYQEISALTGMPIHKGDIETEPLVNCGENLGLAEMVEIGYSFSPYDPVLVKCDVSEDVARIIQERAVDWPGVSIEFDPVRDYPTGEITSGIIGFLGPLPALTEEYYVEQGFVPNRDKVGYAGVELYFDEELRGKNGTRVVEVDVAGQVIRDLEPPQDPVAGENLVLTIDTRLQQAAYEILKYEVKSWNEFLGYTKGSSGVVIAMNPQTGEILAMVYWPTYENNRMARLIPAYYYNQLTEDSTEPLLNHAVGSELPAGSVFKIVTAVAALNEGIVTIDDIIKTPGTITLSTKYYEGDTGQTQTYYDWNWESGGFGQLNIIGAIQNSSNVFFYKVGGGYPPEVEQGVGICRLGTYAKALGYGNYLGVELPDENDGLIPDPTWKRINQGENWSTGDTYLASVGQGYVIVTPLQVLMSAATIANDGKLMQPTLLKQIVDGEGNIIKEFEPVMKWDITDPNTPMIQEFENPDGIGSCKPITDEVGNPVLKSVDPEVIQLVQTGMRNAVVMGTLEDIFTDFPVAAAGKTGTAEYCDDIANNKGLCLPGQWPTHAWTLGYAPFDDPEIVVVAFVYNGGEGASVAGPIVESVMQAYFELKTIDTTNTTQ